MCTVAPVAGMAASTECLVPSVRWLLVADGVLNAVKTTDGAEPQRSWKAQVVTLAWLVSLASAEVC